METSRPVYHVTVQGKGRMRELEADGGRGRLLDLTEVAGLRHGAVHRALKG